MFSVIYYQLFRTRLFRISRYLELIVLFLHLKSTPLCRTCQTPKRPRKSEVRQAIVILSRYSLFAVEGAEIRGQTRQLSLTIDKSTRKNQNDRTFKDFSVQQHLLIYPTYNYGIFTQCLSSNCTVFY